MFIKKLILQNILVINSDISSGSNIFSNFTKKEINISTLDNHDFNLSVDLVLFYVSNNDTEIDYSKLNQVKYKGLFFVSNKKVELEKSMYLFSFGCLDIIETMGLNNKVFEKKIFNTLDAFSKKRENKYTYKNFLVNNELKQISFMQTLLDLTKTEYRVLRFLIYNNEKIISKDRLELEIWGRPLKKESRLLSNHIKNLRKKINQECIKTIPGMGYIFISKDNH